MISITKILKERSKCIKDCCLDYFCYYHHNKSFIMQETNRTFEGEGYKYIIRELRDNFIALTVICQNYGTIFENDGQNLEKIKGKTVETALSKANKAITCKLFLIKMFLPGAQQSYF